MPTERELRQSSSPDGAQVSRPDASQGAMSEGGIMAALSYVGLLFLVPMLFAKKTPFLMFHLRQGIVLFVVEVLVSIIMWIPIVGWALTLGVFALAIMGILQALAGEMRPLPLIGKYAMKVNL